MMDGRGLEAWGEELRQDEADHNNKADGFDAADIPHYAASHRRQAKEARDRADWLASQAREREGLEAEVERLRGALEAIRDNKQHLWLHDHGGDPGSPEREGKWVTFESVDLDQCRHVARQALSPSRAEEREAEGR